MADKIDQIKIGSTAYDIDLPPDASPSITSLKLTDQDSYTMDLHGDGFSVSDAAGYKFAELDLSENRFELGINVTNSGGVTTNRNLHLSTSGLTFTNNESDTSVDIGVQTNGNTSLTLIDRDAYEGIFTGGSFYFGDHTSRFLEFDISETRLEFGISNNDGNTLLSLHPGSISISNKDDETLSIGRLGFGPNPDQLGLHLDTVHLGRYSTQREDGFSLTCEDETAFVLHLGSSSGSCDLVMPETDNWETIRLDLPSKTGVLALTSDITSALQSWQLSNSNSIAGRILVNDSGAGGGFVGGRSGQDSGSFIGFYNETGFAEIQGPLTLKPIPAGYENAGAHGIVISPLASEDTRDVILNIHGLEIWASNRHTLYAADGEIRYIDENAEFETSWFLSENGNLRILHEDYITGDQTQFSVNMSQVLTGTFDSDSGVLVLSTPVKTSI